MNRYKIYFFSGGTDGGSPELLIGETDTLDEAKEVIEAFKQVNDTLKSTYISEIYAKDSSGDIVAGAYCPPEMIKQIFKMANFKW